MTLQSRLFFLLILFTGFALPLYSQTSDSIEKKLDAAKHQFMSGDEKNALHTYEEVLDRDSENFEALWNTAILYSNAGCRLDDEEKQEEKYRTSLEYAEKAVDLYPDKGHSHYAYAVAKGRMTELMGRRDRIKASHDIKESIDTASEMIPNYAPVWHLYGVWHTDVANVSGAVKTIARFISEGLPDASNEKAEEYLKKAINLNGSNILFRLDLARHYVEVDENDKAVEILNGLVKMEPVMQDDSKHLEKARQLLQEID